MALKPMSDKKFLLVCCGRLKVDLVAIDADSHRPTLAALLPSTNGRNQWTDCRGELHDELRPLKPGALAACRCAGFRIVDALDDFQFLNQDPKIAREIRGDKRIAFVVTHMDYDAAHDAQTSPSSTFGTGFLRLRPRHRHGVCGALLEAIDRCNALRGLADSDDARFSTSPAVVRYGAASRLYCPARCRRADVGCPGPHVRVRGCAFSDMSGGARRRGHSRTRSGRTPLRPMGRRRRL